MRTAVCVTAGGVAYKSSSVFPYPQLRDRHELTQHSTPDPTHGGANQERPGAARGGQQRNTDITTGACGVWRALQYGPPLSRRFSPAGVLLKRHRAKWPRGVAGSDPRDPQYLEKHRTAKRDLRTLS